MEYPHEDSRLVLMGRFACISYVGRLVYQAERVQQGEKMEKILTIDTLERLNNSRNGNPRFRVTFTDGTVAQTETDGSVNYVIENKEFRDVPLKVTFTKAGRIKHIARHNS